MSKKHKHEEGHENDERWLITYADMITLLMVFFIVLFSMANTDLKKFAQVAESMQQAFNVTSIGKKPGGRIVGNTGGNSSIPSPFFQSLSPQQRDFISVTSELTTFAAQAGLEGDISVNMNMEGLIISLSEGLIFEAGSPDLKPESLETLHKVAGILRPITNPVRIEGHTDNLPTNDPRYPSNWELSLARSVTIIHYLIDQEGIAPERLLAAGHAEFDPIAPNDNRENRMRNRRADIIIIYPNESRKFSLDMPVPQANNTTEEAPAAPVSEDAPAAPVALEEGVPDEAEPSQP
ncbi:MAG: OmpA family protein [Anaerolineales bacterium]|nr:OmpA family protein [Anaerolineales bacterium]